MNEDEMKKRGEARVWKSVEKPSGDRKAVGSTQIGQQLILEDCLKLLPELMHWINEGSARVYRKQLKEYFDSEDKVLGSAMQTYMLLAGSIQVRSPRVNRPRHRDIMRVGRVAMPGLEFDLVWRFAEVLVDYADYLEVVSELIVQNGSYNRYMKYQCTLPAEIIDKINLEIAVAFYPLPMLEKPIDWSYDEENNISGGYRIHQYDLVRISFSSHEPKENYPQRILDSVNYIQSVPWRVNTRLVAAVSSDMRTPLKEDFIKAEYPQPVEGLWEDDLRDPDCPLNDQERLELEEQRRAYSDQAELYNAEKGDYESELGKYRAIKLAVNVAEKYMGETIYFPHSFDFRGRVYPLPVGLSPQGSDAVKAMLEYERGEKLNEDGILWAWAYLASLFGDDKIPFQERVERGKDLIDADYKEADEPYQFLAHQLELKEFIKDPEHLFKGRIHLDACNSGSQFTSAITGDKAGCMATNVIPTINPDGSQDRQDAYLLVANKALELCNERIGEGSSTEDILTYRFFKELLETEGRKICKKPVMVSNYGGTAGGRTEILWHTMREMKVERKWLTKKVASKFAKLIGDSIHGVLNGGKAFELYIHKMNNIIATSNRPITWSTSDGFRVYHVKQKELKPKQVSCMLPNARRATHITKKVFSNKVSIAKMKSAIAPNYIHSLDAELLRRTALKMKRAGIVDTDWIHDSFGCHPNYVDLMLEITKDEFRKQMRAMPLKVLDAELREQVPHKAEEAAAKVERPSLMGFNAREGGLDIVMDSDWFFS